MSKIEVNEIVNQSGDNDSGIDLTTNDQIGFKIANASKWTLNSSGNLFPASTSQGIVLGATSDTSANRLEDYEEGTWTPFIQASVSNLTVGYAVQNGVYVKVGQLVLASANMEINSFSGGSGNTEVGGLPFTSSATSMFSPHAVLLDNLANDRKQVTVQLANNGTVANYSCCTSRCSIQVLWRTSRCWHDIVTNYLKCICHIISPLSQSYSQCNTIRFSSCFGSCTNIT